MKSEGLIRVPSRCHSGATFGISGIFFVFFATNKGVSQEHEAMTQSLRADITWQRPGVLYGSSELAHVVVTVVCSDEVAMRWIGWWLWRLCWDVVDEAVALEEVSGCEREQGGGWWIQYICAYDSCIYSQVVGTIVLLLNICIANG